MPGGACWPKIRLCQSVIARMKTKVKKTNLEMLLLLFSDAISIFVNDFSD